MAIHGEKGDKGDTGPTPGDIVGVDGYKWGFLGGSSQGWTSVGANLAGGIKDTIRLTATTNDPRMVRSVTPFDGGVMYGVRVKLRCRTASLSTTSSLFYETAAHSFSASYSKAIDVNYRQNEWQYLLFDMRDLTQGGADWVTHNIKAVRFDPAESSQTFEIDGIVIGYFGTADETNYNDERVANNSISISSDGRLNGAGGGQVTRTGIGAESPAGAQSKANSAYNAAVQQAQAKADAAYNNAINSELARNPSGEGVNFLFPSYQNPVAGLPLWRTNDCSVDVVTHTDFNQPSGGNMIRITTSGNDAYTHFAYNSGDYNTYLIPGRHYLISFWVYNRTTSAKSINPYFRFVDNSGTPTYKAAASQNIGAYFKGRVTFIIDMSQSGENQAGAAQLRIDINNGGNGSEIYFDEIMIEARKPSDTSNKPSPYTKPVSQAPIFKTNVIPATVSIGARSSQAAPSFGSYDDTSFTNRARINVSAHTLYTGDGGINYGSGDIRNLPQNTKHYVYVDDPYYRGNNDYKATTNITSITGNNTRRYMGSIRTYNQSSGGGYTGPDDRWYPHIDTWLTETLQVKHAKVGDIIDVVDNGKPGKAAIQALAFSEAECVRLVSESGAAKVVSLDTPIDRHDGTSFLAANAMLGEGEQLLVNTQGQARWETITSAEYVGIQKVAKLSVGGISFFGGEAPESRICTHNMEKP